MLTISSKFRVAHPHAEGVVGVYRMPSVTEWRQYRAALSAIDDDAPDDEMADVMVSLAEALHVRIDGAVMEDGSEPSPWDLGLDYVAAFAAAVQGAVMGKLRLRVSEPTAD